MKRARQAPTETLITKPGVEPRCAFEKMTYYVLELSCELRGGHIMIRNCRIRRVFIRQPTIILRNCIVSVPTPFHSHPLKALLNILCLIPRDIICLSNHRHKHLKSWNCLLAANNYIMESASLGMLQPNNFYHRIFFWWPILIFFPPFCQKSFGKGKYSVTNSLFLWGEKNSQKK